MKYLETFESMIHKKSLDQLKKVKKMMKGIDIDDRVRKDIKEPPKRHVDPLTTVQTYEEYMDEPFKVNQNISTVNKTKTT